MNQHDDYRIKSREFWGFWILISLLSWLLMDIFIGVMIPIEHLLLRERLIYLACLLMIGGSFGGSIGWVQHKLICQFLYWELEQWRIRSLIGGVIGFAAIFAATHFLKSDETCRWFCEQLTDDISFNLIFTLPFVISLSAAQWFTLRHYVRSAWLWILVNILSGILIATLMDIHISADERTLAWLVALIAPGLITGTILLWLFRNMVYAEVAAVEE